MKKVTAFVGSARKKFTYNAVRRFLDNLQSLGNVESEIVCLSDYRLGVCRGCKQCFDRGEEFCPLKDDRDVLFEKIAASDGVIFASPNYSFQVSGLLKIFLDRLGFVFHRPRFFGKTYTSIVAQGLFGGNRIVKYLELVGLGVGFNTVKGSTVTALEPMTDEEQQRTDKTLLEHSRRFHERLMKPQYPVPSLFKLWAFRYARTSMGLLLDESSRDYRYYKEKGWFGSDYYYPVSLGLGKKAAGGLFDWFTARSVGKREG